MQTVGHFLDDLSLWNAKLANHPSNLVVLRDHPLCIFRNEANFALNEELISSNAILVV